MPNNKNDGIYQKKENQRKNILLPSRRNIRRKKQTKTKSHKIPRKYKQHTQSIRILGKKPLTNTISTQGRTTQKPYKPDYYSCT